MYQASLNWICGNSIGIKFLLSTFIRINTEYRVKLSQEAARHMESRSLTVIVLLSALCVSLVHVYIYSCNISVQVVEI